MIREYTWLRDQYDAAKGEWTIEAASNYPEPSAPLDIALLLDAARRCVGLRMSEKYGVIAVMRGNHEDVRSECPVPSASVSIRATGDRWVIMLKGVSPS